MPDYGLQLSPIHIRRQPAFEEIYTPNQIPRVHIGKGYNADGYQCDEFNDRRDLNIMFFGDSWAQGDGLALEQCFAEIVRAKLAVHFGASVANWNMAHGGKGYDYAARTLLCSLDKIKPDIVVLAFGVFDRREYFLPTGELVNFSLGTIGAIEQKVRLTTPEIKSAFENWSKLTSHHDDAALAIRCFKLIKFMLEARNIVWCFTTTPWEDTVARVEELVKFDWFDNRNYLGFPFDHIDQVSETDLHPGPESHRSFAAKVTEWLVDRHADRIEKIVLGRKQVG